MASYPTSVWDGDSANRDSDDAPRKAPDYRDYNRCIAEVGAAQTLIDSQKVVTDNLAVGVDSDAIDTVGVLETVTGLSVVEKGDGALHKTIITLASVAVASTDAGANGAQATKKLYTFSEGQIVILGAHQVYPLAGLIAVTAGGAGFDPSADFSIGVGSAEANAGVDLAGTEQDICAKADVDLTTKTSDAIESGINAALLPLDGSTTAISVWLNVSTLDDADHGAAADVLTVNGTITIVWTVLGND